jgi:bifunctional oligoribonuclease and PAP phosphatase NrnA
MIPTPPVPDALIDAMLSHEASIIIGHKNPDADCLNSQYLVQSILHYYNKKTLLLSPGPFERQEIKQYEGHFSTSVPDSFLKLQPLVIIVDCSTPDRIEPFNEVIEGLTVAVIDHHAAGTDFGDIRYVFPKAFSVTFLIYHIMKKMKVPLNAVDAQRILFGLAADTGFFRHINEGRSEVFSMTAELAEAGASPRDIYQTLYGDRSYQSRKLLGLLLTRTESNYDGRLLVTWETLEENEFYGEAERDSDALYAQLLAVRGCEVVLYFRQEARLRCTVGFRAGANSSIDVGLIASGLGGGGHKKASGTTLEMELGKAMTTVIGILAFYLGS